MIQYNQEKKRDKVLELLDIEFEKKKKRKKALGIVEVKNPDDDVMDILKGEDAPNNY